MIYFYTGLLLFVLSGCGNGTKTTNSGDDPEMISELGFNPSERWVKVADFSYEYNVNGCRTGYHAFKNQKDYCLGLMNTVMNQSCAQSLRESVFAQDCGENFQQIYIPAPLPIKAYDSRLKRYCETAKSSFQIFQFLSEVCGFLKNENLHKSCHWGPRFEKFESLSCRGKFSQEP